MSPAPDSGPAPGTANPAQGSTALRDAMADALNATLLALATRSDATTTGPASYTVLADAVMPVVEAALTEQRDRAEQAEVNRNAQLRQAETWADLSRQADIKREQAEAAVANLLACCDFADQQGKPELTTRFIRGQISRDAAVLLDAHAESRRVWDEYPKVIEALREQTERAEEAERERDAVLEIMPALDTHVVLFDPDSDPCVDWCPKCLSERAERAERDRDKALDQIATEGLEACDARGILANAIPEIQRRERERIAAAIEAELDADGDGSSWDGGMSNAVRIARGEPAP